MEDLWLFSTGTGFFEIGKPSEKLKKAVLSL